MAAAMAQHIPRDPQLFYWILFPITVVMILTGVLRHFATTLLASTPKPPTPGARREQLSLARGINLRTNHAALTQKSFAAKRDYLVTAFKEGKFLKDPEGKEAGGGGGMAAMDPAAMEGLMGAMKGNMMMMVPQTLIMSWINAFFAGFVIMKLPFPLTLRFKSMLQSGIATRDLDVRWVSSLSWYFMNLFGLQSVFIFILGNDNAASQMAAQMGGMNPAAGGNMFQPGQDPAKIFQSEAENLEVLAHWSVLDGIEDRILVSKAR